MRNFIRNDYTLINRLQQLADKKLEQERSMSSFDRKLIPVFRIHMKINKLIDNIKEDMKLKMMDKINSSESFRREYECIFNTTE